MKSSPLVCPFCEGHTVQGRKTLYCYATHYHCFRCNAHGRLSELKDIEINIERTRQVGHSVFNNLSSSRFSVCCPKSYEGGVETFQIKMPDGRAVGKYQRKGKQSIILGQRGFCFRDEFLKLGGTYRLVEGVYDCIYPEDIACLGIPTKGQARMLLPYNLILTPDGDVWENKNLLEQWIKPFSNRKDLKVEYISSGKDPDECPVTLRKITSIERVLQLL